MPALEPLATLAMNTAASSTTPAIIESLYREALLLADEARSAFERPPLAQASAALSEDDGMTRIALSCEALRTTTRMMHVLAWLLNHRAFFAGELSEFQLRRHGRLPAAQPMSDPAQLALLDDDALQVVEQSRAFYARVERLDNSWRTQAAPETRAVHRLQGRLGSAFSA